MKKILILILLALFTFAQKVCPMIGPEEVPTESDEYITPSIKLTTLLFELIENGETEKIKNYFRKHKNLCEKSFIENCMRMAQNFERENIVNFLYSKLTSPDLIIIENSSDTESSSYSDTESSSDTANTYARAMISIRNFSLGPQQEL